MNNTKEEYEMIERETIPFKNFYEYLEKNPGKNIYRYSSRFYTYKGWDHTAHIFQDSDFDTDYFLKQMQFLESLTEEERKVLASYTKYGDQLINGFLRGQWNNKSLFDFISSRMAGPREDDTPSWDEVFGDIFKDLTEDNCMAQVSSYVKKYIELFKKVPPVEKPIRVFRGVRVNDTFDPRKSGIKSPTIDFLSTTYAPDDSLLNRYAGEGCCIYEFVIYPGVRALWIQPLSYYRHEKEILIEYNIALYSGCSKFKELMFEKEEDDDEDDEDHGYKFRYIQVYDFEIKPYESAFNKMKRVTRKVLRFFSACGRRRNKNNNTTRGKRGRNNNSNNNSSNSPNHKKQK
jgi:hypothetical protein